MYIKHFGHSFVKGSALWNFNDKSLFIPPISWGKLIFSDIWTMFKQNYSTCNFLKIKYWQEYFSKKVIHVVRKKSLCWMSFHYIYFFIIHFSCAIYKLNVYFIWSYDSHLVSYRIYLAVYNWYVIFTVV